MKLLVLLLVLLAAPAGLRAQTPAKESDALQSLMAEVHQLRPDIAAMTVASQRVQIAVYALQAQDAAVARAMQRADAAGNKCKSQEENRQHFVQEVQSVEGEVANGATDTNRVRVLQAHLTDVKSTLEQQTAAIQACQAIEAEAASQLRNEQTKLVELQDRLTRLDKSLEQAGRDH